MIWQLHIDRDILSRPTSSVNRALGLSVPTPLPRRSTRTADAVGWVCSTPPTARVLRSVAHVDCSCPPRRALRRHATRLDRRADSAVISTQSTLTAAPPSATTAVLPTFRVCSFGGIGVSVRAISQQNTTLSAVPATRPTPPPHRVRCSSTIELPRTADKVGGPGSRRAYRPPRSGI
jgi:hypothetical protein